MNERTKSRIVWAIAIPPTLYGAYVLSVIFSQPTTLLPVDAKGPATPYTSEISDHRYNRIPRPCDASGTKMSKSERMDCWRKIDREMRIAPDGSAELSLERAPFTHGIEGCHELWINYKNGQKRRIAKLSEADPGSGTSFSFAWSKDSKAVLLYGQTSGFNCKRSRWREFGSVYTLADEKLREVELK